MYRIVICALIVGACSHPASVRVQLEEMPGVHQQTYAVSLSIDEQALDLDALGVTDAIGWLRAKPRLEIIWAEGPWERRIVSEVFVRDATTYLRPVDDVTGAAAEMRWQEPQGSLRVCWFQDDGRAPFSEKSSSCRLLGLHLPFFSASRPVYGDPDHVLVRVAPESEWYEARDGRMKVLGVTVMIVLKGRSSR